MSQLQWERMAASDVPFPHRRFPEIVSPAQSDAILQWLRRKAPWTLRIEDFYQQHEFSLLNTPLDGVSWLASKELIAEVAGMLRRDFNIERELTLVDVNAHRLKPGQVIRIHNDFIEGAETHRLLIQLNSGWSAEQGGLLMLFESDQTSSLKNVILPEHGSGFAFEISPRSFHAVSEVKGGERYTLVYTFR